MTVDPFNITKFSRTQAELEELLMFCTAVPGHNAKTTSECLDKFLLGAENSGETPFDIVRFWTPTPPTQMRNESLIGYGIRMAWVWRRLMKKVRESGIGCATRVAKCWWELSYSKLDLKTCSAEELEKIHGIGFKTSRFFILHSRKDQTDVAVLDVHVLRWLKEKGHKVPEITPSSKSEYGKIEKIFLDYAKKSGKTVAEFDLDIWKKGAAK